MAYAAQDEKWMRLALDQAETALSEGEFPVGCVITDGEEVVASGSRISSRGSAFNELDHAEIVALRGLFEKGVDRPEKESLCIYSTLEPCLMCFGAIVIAGIRRIVYAFEDAMGGGTACGLDMTGPLYRQPEPEIAAGVLREESLALMRRFFSNPENRYLKDTLFERYTLKCS